ncbi:MAG: thioredoxin family protein [Euzebyales bacterium]|nr:thioredoxin family protein [Euzebyales bacterium]
MNVTLLYFEGCPNWKVADERVSALSDELGLAVERRLIETPEEAEAVGFRGSPTILVDGRDPFATGDESAGLACRIYQTPEGPQGAPTAEQLRVALV